MENVGAAGADGAAAGAVTAAMVVGALAVLKTCEYLLSVVGDIAETVIRVEDAAALGL